MRGERDVDELDGEVITEFETDEEGHRLCPECGEPLFDSVRHVSCSNCGLSAKRRVVEVVYERLD